LQASQLIIQRRGAAIRLLGFQIGMRQIRGHVASSLSDARSADQRDASFNAAQRCYCSDRQPVSSQTSFVGSLCS
jgi:hypothetical protein